MSVWDDTIESESHVTGSVQCRRAAGCNDTGCTGNGEHTALWDVYITGQSTGSSGNSRSPQRPNPALQYEQRAHAESDYDDLYIDLNKLYGEGGDGK